jgi:hypothetical protein
MKVCLSAVSFIARYMSVSTAPGTRTPCGPHSAASACVRPISPDFAGGVGGNAGRGEAVADEGRGGDRRAAAVGAHA